MTEQINASLPQKLVPTRSRWRMRWYQALHAWGWPGLIGLFLFPVGMVLAGLAMVAKLELSSVEKRFQERTDAALRRPPPADLTSGLARAQPKLINKRLPSRAQALSIIAQAQRLAQQHQVIWQAADFRYKAATNDSVARLEVNGSLHGSYKSMRLWLNRLHSEFPSMALQQASFSRPNADLGDVDAKLLLAFGLADTAVEPKTAASHPSVQAGLAEAGRAAQGAQGASAARTPREVMP